MKILIIGLGSIGKKHASVIFQICPGCEIFALRRNHPVPEFLNVINIYSLNDVPDDLDFILVSNPSSEHCKTIKSILQFNKPIFIEKPPVLYLEDAKQLEKEISSREIKTYVAFNMRFNSILNWVKDNINLKNVLEASCYCGSYLPDWRRNSDYRKIYSAIKRLGGGVHFDLIHEIDYARYIFGEPEKIWGFSSKISKLAIDSVDVAHYWLEYKSWNMSITLNYYRKDPKRSLEIVMDRDTWNVDLIKGQVVNSNGKSLYEDKNATCDSYIRQMEFFIQHLKSGTDYENNFKNAIKTLQICSYAAN